MTKLALTVAAVPYDRVRPLMDGRVEIEGCDPSFFPMEPEELFHRAYTTQDFDVTEISSSSHILTTARGEAPYIAIPVPLVRIFRHGSIYIRTDRGIERPEDLRGKTVGVPEYQMTNALWVRGLLADEYGVKAEDIRWRNGGLLEPGRTERTPITLPDAIELKPVPQGTTLSSELERGGLDALIAPRPPLGFPQSKKIGYLFRDIRAAEEAYYKKTRLFPIMHLVGIRRTLAEKHPWLPVSVFKAFSAAREAARVELQQVAALHPMNLPWIVEDLARVEAAMGPDFGRYGLADIRKELDAMLRWSIEQGLSRRAPRLDELFAPSTLDIAVR